MPRQQDISQTSEPISSFSPGCARALTTPTPIPGLELNPVVFKIKEDEMNDKKASGDTASGSGQHNFPRNHSSGPIGMSRIQQSLLQNGGQNPSQHQSSSGPITPTPPTNSSSTQVVSKQPKPMPAPKRAQILFKKIKLEDPKLKKPVVKKLMLTQLLTAQSASSSSNNPYKCFYAFLASKERNALKILLYYPFSKEPSKPIKILMKANVCVEEVVGFSLWNYVEEKCEPKLGEIKNCPDGLDLHETFAWCLRLVEDDGKVDEDFHALDCTIPSAKVGSNEFAMVMATEAQGDPHKSWESLSK
ncbi:mitogen-activated protein kinase associated protein 1 [Puccinia graminis f. sp. tritici]|uniref:Mitogen-activated protein kinase associated protein 1 n=1 Tax=Puccinia graminis f. sp. tritici TaxID=56615 RepID=A0A5B0QBG6_PUCGR|nr:mitogen-activated protein kinase associated protein 1 [Puccinia graminis f. sp. tritici]